MKFARKYRQMTEDLPVPERLNFVKYIFSHRGGRRGLTLFNIVATRHDREPGAAACSGGEAADLLLLVPEAAGASEGDLDKNDKFRSLSKF